MPEAQKVEYLPLKDLVLWTENPRDPIDPHASNASVLDRAISDKKLKWNLKKLALEMGAQYDLSELPTVVMIDGKYVVFDGNRRIALGFIKHNLYQPSEPINFRLPEFPENIPCNVCTQGIALNNVLRKHGDSGSWAPLERDLFLHKYMGAEKSTLMVIDEATNLITENQHLNQRFVKEEVFKEDILKQLGFEIKDYKLNSKHSPDEALTILNDISKNIETKNLSTRNNRGDVIKVLDDSTKEIIHKNKGNGLNEINPASLPSHTSQTRITRRISVKEFEIFGRKLSLRSGDVNNLYRDIKEVYELFASHKSNFSPTFVSLIRMSLRLIVELAGTEVNSSVSGKPLDVYINKYFASAKLALDQNTKTFLSSQNVKSNTILQLLNTGAHSYSSSANKDQAIAISIIVGEMLALSHGK